MPVASGARARKNSLCPSPSCRLICCGRGIVQLQLGTTAVRVKSLADVAAVVAVVLVALAVFVYLRRSLIPPAPYQRIDALFSPAELRFLMALDGALGPNYRIFGKVRIADLAAVRPGLNAKARQAAFNRVACKHFDFVVCSSGECAPLCAVELNDSSHATSRAKRRDAFVAAVCKAIDLPLVTVAAARSHDATALQKLITDAVGVGEGQRVSGGT